MGVRPGRVLALAGVLAAGVLLLKLVPPGTSWIYPPCLFHRLTQLQCPGCGATRAVALLLKGDVTAALRHNAMLVVATPPLLWSAGRSLWPWVQGQKPPATRIHPGIIAGVLLSLALFGLVRNLPFDLCRWLSPP